MASERIVPMAPWSLGTYAPPAPRHHGAAGAEVPKVTMGASMKVLAVVSQKGGGGKSTVCTNLAVASSSSGVRTALFDLDPQQSSFVWGSWRGQGRARSGAAPLEILASDCASLPSRIAAAQARGVGLLILDTPPAKGPESDMAAGAADVVLIVVQPSILDLITLAETHSLGGVSNGPAFVVFNRVPTGEAIMRDARQRVVEAGFRVAPVWLSDRAIYRSAIIDGLGVIEADRGERKAASEVEALYRWACLQLTAAPPRGPRGDDANSWREPEL